ncbi:MAG: RNA chaperone Hfq [Holosporales bacterium]|jgi:host factor-I protein|nr:RNA chaperone Hfq [Holosporales bacterium]
MSERIINIQDAFLNYVRKNKVSLTVFLLNGVKLNGIVSCFDQNSIVIKRDGYSQLLYKHAISTFSPHKAVNVFDSAESQQDSKDDSEDEPEKSEAQAC